MHENLRTFIEEKANKLGEKNFLTFKDKKISYADLDRESNRMAKVFLDIGVSKGDTVCVMLPNCIEYFYVWFGLAKIGAVLIPLNYHLKGMGLEYVIEHSDTELIIFDRKVKDQLLPVFGKNKKIKNKIVVSPPGWTSPENYLYFDQLRDKYSPDSPPKIKIERSDLMSILYTSGTTGPPKGVMLSHYAYLNGGREGTMVFELGPDDIAYTTLPLFHINAQQLTTMGCLTAEIPMVLAERFSLSNFWDDIRKSGATIVVFIGSMTAVLFKQPEKEEDGLNNLRAGACAAMPNEIWKEFEKRFQLKIVECYGLTETSTLATRNPYHAVKFGSIGKPVSYADVEIWSEDNKKLMPGEVGEIVVKGKQPHVLFEGYFKMPDKTKESMYDGWFKTGDRGYYDEDGYFYFVDRLKECIRRRGENISPYEVEKVVSSHPNVLECAAIGVPSELGEEDVKLCVVVKPEENITPEEIYNYCRDRMSYFMVPRYIVFKELLPKTETQKVQKYVLKNEGLTGAWDSEKFKNVNK